VAGQAVSAFVCTVDVPDLDVSLETAARLGATLAVPKMPIPGVGWLAYVTDPEGNIVGMMQADPAAK
jgi:predicted enzyme related to lactoylglutathione lyase